MSSAAELERWARDRLELLDDDTLRASVAMEARLAKREAEHLLYVAGSVVLLLEEHQRHRGHGAGQDDGDEYPGASRR